MAHNSEIVVVSRRSPRRRVACASSSRSSPPKTLFYTNRAFSQFYRVLCREAGNFWTLQDAFFFEVSAEVHFTCSACTSLECEIRSRIDRDSRRCKRSQLIHGSNYQCGMPRTVTSRPELFLPTLSTAKASAILTAYSKRESKLSKALTSQ